MSNKKDALKDVIAKARELSEIAPADRSEEQNTELKSYMDQGQSLRDEIVRDEKLDDFAGKVADTEPNGAKSAPEIDYAVLGRDGGQPNTPFLARKRRAGARPPRSGRRSVATPSGASRSATRPILRTA